MTHDITLSPEKRSRCDQLLWRPMTFDDLPEAYALSQQLGWPHRLEDWQQMLSLSEGVALKTAQGALIGTGFCLKQGAFATLGLVVIDAAWQGLGLGRAMMTRLMALAEKQTLMLVATRAGEPLYTKLGFTAYQRVYQYQGVVQARDHTRAADIRGLRREDDAELLENHLVSPAYALALDDAVGGVVLERQGKLVGVALRRAFGRGEHIGPVLAASEADARELIQSLLTEMNGVFVRLDLLEIEADDWLTEWGVRSVDQVTQMHLGPLMDEAELKRFGLMTQAIG